jgi:hypothetical protein
VAYLFLGVVGDVTGHRSGDDKTALALLLEDGANGLCTVVHTSQVSVDDLVPVLNAGLENTSVGSLSGIGDHDIDLAKVLDNIVDELLYGSEFGDTALVGLALDTELLRDFFGVLLTTGRTRCVGDGNVGAHLSTSSSSFSANASGTGGTSDDDDLALQAEEVLETSLLSAQRFEKLRHASFARECGGYSRISLGNGLRHIGGGLKCG